MEGLVFQGFREVDNHVEYHAACRRGLSEWRVAGVRFSSLLALHKDLASRYPGVALPDFPRKTLRSPSAAVSQARVQALNGYFDAALRTPLAYDPALRDFFKAPEGSGGAASPFLESLGERGRRGFLMKKGQLVKNWKRRFVVLRRGRLCYYEGEEAGLPEKGSVVVSSECEVREWEQRPLGFVLASPGRTIYFCAEDERSRAGWMLALRKAIQRASPEYVERQRELLRDAMAALRGLATPDEAKARSMCSAELRPVVTEMQGRLTRVLDLLRAQEELVVPAQVSQAQALAARLVAALAQVQKNEAARLKELYSRAQQCAAPQVLDELEALLKTLSPPRPAVERHLKDWRLQQRVRASTVEEGGDTSSRARMQRLEERIERGDGDAEELLDEYERTLERELERGRAPTAMLMEHATRLQRWHEQLNKDE